MRIKKPFAYKKHTLFLGTAFALICMGSKQNNLYAQAARTVKTTTHTENTGFFFRTLSQTTIQINAGTQGIGGEIKTRLLNKLSARLGAAFMPVSASNVKSIKNPQSEINLKANFSNIHLLAEYAPFHKDNFRLVAGAAYLLKAYGKADVIPTGTYSYGDITLTKDELGTESMKVFWKGIAPYAGISLFKGFPKNIFNVNLDLGTYYLSAPHAVISGTGLLDGSSTYSKKMEENVKGYRWQPVLQLNFNFKL